MTEPTTPAPQLNRAGRRAQSRRLRKTGALMATIPAAFGTTALVIGATSGVAGGATTLTVNTLNDGAADGCTTDPDGCTLRDALADATDGDTIVFASGLTGTIDLTNGQLVVGYAVDIQGPGAYTGPTGIAIDGQNSNRIFYINLDGSGTEVTISGLTLRNGLDGDGGAIYDADADLTINDAVISGNTASDDGGAIHGNNTGIDLTINRTTFSGNYAESYGGAIGFYGIGSLTITDSTFTGNEAGEEGGAIYLYNTAGAVTITGTSFTDNTAGDDGGAVRVDSGGSPTVSITGSTFSGNAAYVDGGAVAVDYRVDLTVTDSTFTDNYAGGEGGALYGYCLTGLTISGSTLSDNTADDDGGGIALSADGCDNGPVMITSSSISGNTAGDDGGGLYAYSVSGAVTISDTMITGNSASGGGGGLNFQYVTGDVDITGSTISANTANAYGGGIYADDLNGTTTIAFSTIADNHGGGGGGIEWYESEALLIRNSAITGNSSTGYGGGLYVDSDTGLVQIVNSTVSGNTADGDGGAISFNGYTGLEIVQSTIVANEAPLVGGILIYDSQEGAAAATGKPADEARVADAEAGEHPNPSGARARTGDTVRATEVGTVTVDGSIIALNSGADIGDTGTVEMKGSLFGTISGTTLVDQGGNLQGVDPLLGPLQDNGGPTRTHALLDGSPAINAGLDPVADFPGNDDDQRGPGYARVVGGRVDIGAFEVQPTNIEPTFTG